MRARQAGGSFLEERNNIPGPGLSRALQHRQRLPSSEEGSGSVKQGQRAALTSRRGREETRKGYACNCRDGHRSIQTHLGPRAHPGPTTDCTHHRDMHTATHAKRQAVRHPAGAEARSINLQLPSGDKPSTGGLRPGPPAESACAPHRQVLQSRVFSGPPGAPPHMLALFMGVG